ncbi:MAG: PilT/PilU family type 4a pilus ATPase [Mariprofundales bacterium]
MADWHLIDDLLLATVKHGASDLFVRTADRVRMKRNGVVVTLPPKKVPPQTRAQVKEMVLHMSRRMRPPPTSDEVEEMYNFDFRYSLEKVSFFRVHMMKTDGNFCIVARVIPQEIPSFEKMNQPPVLRDICQYRNGIVLVSGATGSGKSTTLSAMLDFIIRTRPVHVVTLEDPIEFRYPTEYKGTVAQRELGQDFSTFTQALHDCLREAPDIIVAGELRDSNIIQLSLTAAETGHLVMATVHASTAVGTLQRVMGAFKPEQQDSLRERLSESLRTIIAQKLLPTTDGKRCAVQEIMIRNSVIKHFLLDPDRWSEMSRVMEEGSNLYGSQSFDQHLQELVEAGRISYEDAVMASVFPEDFAMRMGRED